MAQTQRVLSGSRTKGSTATPSGSIIYSYQGINARTTTSYFGSLLPRIGSGDRIKLYKDGNPISEKYFDDESTMNADVTDMRGLSGSLYETRIGFDLERLTFGQAPTTQQGEPFADIRDFDPVAYVTDPGHTMWPVNLWNLGTLPDHEFDGVIEPFDIRRSILGEVDLRFEGHAPRGSVTGPFSENLFGSTEITGEWKKSDKPLSPFFDGPNQLARDRNRDLPVLARMNYHEAQLYPAATSSVSFSDPNSAMPLQGYQGLERELLNPFVSQDYHDIIYSEVRSHNPPLTFMSQSAYNLNVGWSTALYRYAAYPNLVAWFRLNEVGSPLTAVTAQDSGPLNFTGSIAGCTNFAGSLPTGFTAQTSVFDFDGVGDVVTFTGGNTGSGKTWDDLVGGYYDNVNSINYLKSFTMCAWVRQENDFGIVLNIGAKSSTDGGGFYIRANSSGAVTFWRYSGPSGNTGILGIQTAADTVPDDTWTHIACVADFSQYDESGTANDYFHVYANGVKETSSITEYATGVRLRNATMNVNAAAMGGTTQTGGTSLHGQIADVSVFDRALSSEEINAIYNATLGGLNKIVVQQDPLETALEDLNRASCERLTDPLEKRGARGFYFGEKAGSIVYGDW